MRRAQVLLSIGTVLLTVACSEKKQASSESIPASGTATVGPTVEGTAVAVPATGQANTTETTIPESWHGLWVPDGSTCPTDIDVEGQVDIQKSMVAFNFVVLKVAKVDVSTDGILVFGTASDDEGNDFKTSTRFSRSAGGVVTQHRTRDDGNGKVTETPIPLKNCVRN